MRVQALASGSNGNCTVVEADHGVLLIDAGISRKRILDGLKTLNIHPGDVIGILITHAHSDHVMGLPVLSDYITAPVIAPSESIEELQQLTTKDPRYSKIAREAVPLPVETPMKWGKFEITAYATIHDIAGSVGFSVKDVSTDLRLSYATDTGELSDSFIKTMQQSELIVLESNHDEKMLWESRRPNWLKQRIRATHLSNKEAHHYLHKIITECTQAVFLAHLSGRCNSPTTVAQFIHHHLLNLSDYDHWKWAICTRSSKSSLVNLTNSTQLTDGVNINTWGKRIEKQLTSNPPTTTTTSNISDFF